MSTFKHSLPTFTSGSAPRRKSPAAMLAILRASSHARTREAAQRSLRPSCFSNALALSSGCLVALPWWLLSGDVRLFSGFVRGGLRL